MKKLITIATSLSIAFVSAAFADPVEETFDESLPKTTWNLLGKPSTSEGTLILKGEEGDSQAYVDCGIIAKEGNPTLNFVQEPIEVSLSGLNFGGTAEDANRLFMLIIGSNSPKETQAASYVKLRLSADGRASVVVAEGGQPDHEVLSTQVSYPIESLVLKLSATQVALTTKSTGAPDTTTGDLQGLFDPSAWTDASPYLVLKGVRRPSSGDCEVTLEDLKISAAK